MNKTNPFTHTRAALAKWQLGESARQQMWDEAENAVDVHKAEFARDEALRQVQDAFYEDTKHFNQLHHVRLVSIDDVVRMIDPPLNIPGRSKVSMEQRIGGWAR